MPLVWGQNQGSLALANVIGAYTDKSVRPARSEQPTGGHRHGLSSQSAANYKSLKTKQLSPNDYVTRVPKRDNQAGLACAFCGSSALSRIDGDGTFYGREVQIPPRFKSGYRQADKAVEEITR